MAKQITDDEDRLKRQARRRLIGAVALTTAMIVVLPMVLDSEPKPVGQDIELRIPDKDKAGEFVPKIDTPPASAPLATPSVSPPVAVSAPLPIPAVVSPPVLVAPVVAPVVAAKPDAKPASPPAKTPAIAPEHKPEPAKHEAKPDQPKHDSKTDQAKRDAKPIAKAAGTAHTEQGHPVPKSGFVVQIGAFANADTAHSWQKNLNAQGFKAYTEKLGNKTRVRIGPFSTRDAANKTRHKLEAKGLHANVVALE